MKKKNNPTPKEKRGRTEQGEVKSSCTQLVVTAVMTVVMMMIMIRIMAVVPTDPCDGAGDGPGEGATETGRTTEAALPAGWGG